MVTRQQRSAAIRMLSVDMVEAAQSGHPGMPLGMADIAEVLWMQFLKHNPLNPHWPNRDRFVLSNGHGSALLYSLLHLTGYDLPLNELKRFRQLHSKTPGHPEVGITPGVETSTGPLGQGIANAVGMAIAEKILAAQFNRKDFSIIDHYTYAFLSDGCLMEGVSHEVCSLAGTLGLNKLIAFWDNNGISIDGKVEGWFTDDTPKRFEAYGWHVVRDVDGHNAEAIEKAIQEARQITDRPTLICCRTIIGFGAPHKAGTAACHGSPLGKEEVEGVRKALQWNYPPFEIPKNIYEAWNFKEKGSQLEQEWQKLFNAYKKAYPDLANELKRRWNKQLPAAWDSVQSNYLKQLMAKSEVMATRKASLKALEMIGPVLPELIGGSADLTGSNLTEWSTKPPLSKTNSDANYIHYGVREFGMSAIMNGMALHGEFIPYGGTFLVFFSYAASAVRMAALMKQRVIFVYTHDSIGLGEDGPSHQPIEQATALRVIPNLSVWRPCDVAETAVAWRSAIERTSGPTALLLSRQNLPFQPRDELALSQIKRGAYILLETHPHTQPDIILIATGSEINLAIKAAQFFIDKPFNVRVVSMPSADKFLEQEHEYQEAVLPSACKKRVAIEAGNSTYWYSWVGNEGIIIGLDQFGASAPLEYLFTEYGFTVEQVIANIETLFKLNNRRGIFYGSN